jgi:hypothetical protein
VSQRHEGGLAMYKLIVSLLMLGVTAAAIHDSQKGDQK